MEIWLNFGRESLTKGIKVFRTDENGTIAAVSDGKSIVYYTPGGKSYYYDKNCSTLARSKTILSGKLSDVINLGKSDTCDKCVR